MCFVLEFVVSQQPHALQTKLEGHSIFMCTMYEMKGNHMLSGNSVIQFARCHEFMCVCFYTGFYTNLDYCFCFLYCSVKNNTNTQLDFKRFYRYATFYRCTIIYILNTVAPSNYFVYQLALSSCELIFRLVISRSNLKLFQINSNSIKSAK